MTGWAQRSAEMAEDAADAIERVSDEHAALSDCRECAVAKRDSLRVDAGRWRKLRDTPATSVAPGPMRGWLFMRPAGAEGMDRMADELPEPNVAVKRPAAFGGSV